MPAGVDVVVEDGFATIEFTDPAKKGPGLAGLLKHTPAEMVDKVTRPRVAYTVPEGNARAAGLLDDTEPETTGDEDDQVILYPEGDPEKSWGRAELDAYALDKYQLDTSGLPNKDAVLAAITEAAAAS